MTKGEDPTRLSDVLVKALRTNSSFTDTSFTVTDLYQQILPFRHWRRELGIDTNQEYELGLMRLLSNSPAYLDVEERLRDEMAKELANQTPNPARLREFPDSRIVINGAALAKEIEKYDAARPAANPTQSAHRCRFCAGALPGAFSRALNYCPHCGQNLRVLNCPACGAEFEAGWKFCAACGKSVDSLRGTG